MRKQTAFCRILAAVVFVSCAILLVAPTFARNENNASWQNTLYSLGGATVSSDLLTSEGQTVVINELSDTRDIEIHLTSDGGASSGTLTCSSGHYVTVSVEQPQVAIPAGETITVKATLKRTEMPAADACVESVQVVWTPETGSSETLWADIQISIVPTVTVSDPEGIASDATSDQNTALETEQSSTGQSDKKDTISASLISSWVSSYSSDIPIALTISPLNEVTLQCNDGSFPALTRYTIEGKSVVLYDGGEITVQSNRTVTMLVDISHTDLISDTGCSVTASAEEDGQKLVQTIALSKTEYSRFVAPNYPLVLTEDETLDLSVQNQWGGGGNVFVLSRLEADESGRVRWVQLEEESWGIHINQAGENVILSMVSENRPPAGTYQIKLARYFGDTEVFCEKIVFFVQFSSSANTTT